MKVELGVLAAGVDSEGAGGAEIAGGDGLGVAGDGTEGVTAINGEDDGGLATGLGDDDDALLVVTLATNVPDDSPGTPAGWAQAVIDAKNGDADAIVAFGITVPKYKGECDPMDRICQLVEQFPYSYWINNETLDYGPAFEVATGLVEEACGAFIPQ